MQDRSAAVIVAVNSCRTHGNAMLWTMLAGRILLARTLDVFEASPLIDTILLVVDAAHAPHAHTLCQQEQWQKVAAVAVGDEGTRRQDAVRVGLDTLAMFTPPPRWVLIHDGARPLLPHLVLEAGLQAVQEHHAVSAAVPVKETIKQVGQGRISATLDRSQLWTVQTPHIFSFPLIHQAHHAPLAREDVSDDVALLQRLGQPVTIFHGSYSNIKVTTPEDVLLAEALLEEDTP